MRRNSWIFLLIPFALAASANPAIVQNEEELSRLRNYLSLPPSTNVTFSNTIDLPKNRPLAVYIATDPEPSKPGQLQTGARAEVERFIAEHNRHNKESLQISVVDALDRADVVLVQFEAAEKRRPDLVSRDTSDPRSAMGTVAGGGSFEPVYRSEIRGYVLIHAGGTYTMVDAYKLSVRLVGRRLELRRAFERALKSKHG